MNLRTPITEEAKSRDLTAEGPFFHPIQIKLPCPEKSKKMLEALKEWIEADEKLTDDEMKRNREVLQSIDDNRLSDRKLFDKLLSESIVQ